MPMRRDFTNVATYSADGRKPFGTLYDSFSQLADAGWIEEDVAVSRRERDGGTVELPILSYRTPKKGPAVWIIGGIHGEEPAGPNAISDAIPYILDLGLDIPVIVLPVCNPLGYHSSWRYLNQKKWAPGGGEQSAGDSEHVLPDPKKPDKVRSPSALSPESAALVNHVIALAQDYPPVMTVDLHEDDLIDEGYIYSQGGAADPVAQRIVGIIRSRGIAIKQDGLTRFGEAVVNGIVGKENDGSIDELLSAHKIIVGGKEVQGPAAKTAIVVETPAGALPLDQRKSAQLEILKNLKELAAMALRTYVPSAPQPGPG